MTITALRYADRIVSLDGGTTINLPTDLYEFQDSGGLRSAELTVWGTDHAYDLLRNAPSPREVAKASVRVGVGLATPTLSDAFIDQLRSTLLAMGPFYLQTVGADGSRRQARCRLAQMPDMLISYERSITTLASLEMRRFTDWMATTPTTWSQPITATPTSWTVNNPGALPVQDVVIRLRANASNFFTNPVLENLTNGYRFSSARDGVNANSELMLDTKRAYVGWSTNDGGSYADDIAQVIFSATQFPLSFRLDAGDNTLRYTNTGTPGLNIDGSFYARWG